MYKGWLATACALLLVACSGSSSSTNAGKDSGATQDGGGSGGASQDGGGSGGASGAPQDGGGGDASDPCQNGIQDGLETSRDCGGGVCPACPPGGSCNDGSDCQSGLCAGGLCVAPRCDDGVKNGTETDVDCGGGCGGCNDGKQCGANTDCANGVCTGGVCSPPVPTCAAPGATNAGCEFWAVDLDQQDYAGSDPASAPWGVLLTNPGANAASVTIEQNDAAVGQAPSPSTVQQVNVAAHDTQTVTMPTRELDCGTTPNDPTSPGTCLSSRAYRITSTTPIVVHQVNALSPDASSNDASLLLPTHTLGKRYRVVGWPAGHPMAFPPLLPNADRAYVTVVGTQASTNVTVKPTFRIKGNPPIAATAAGGSITVTLGPFDVLNLETDDATQSEAQAGGTDLSGSAVEADQPVAVFSGVETGGVPGMIKVATPPGWTSDQTCCLDHLEEQLLPAEALGTSYYLARSPVLSTGGFSEADVLRFVGVAESTTVTTNLPAPLDSFTLAPGEVKTTSSQTNVVVTATKPLLVAQYLVAGQYVAGAPYGDPSFAVVPPVARYQTHYALTVPASWPKQFVVLAAPVGATLTVDGATPSGCANATAGIGGVPTYNATRCPITPGYHELSGDQPFGVMLYGYSDHASYAAAGGTGVKHAYAPPPL